MVAGWGLELKHVASHACGYHGGARSFGHGCWRGVSMVGGVTLQGFVRWRACVVVQLTISSPQLATYKCSIQCASESAHTHLISCFTSRSASNCKHLNVCLIICQVSRSWLYQVICESLSSFRFWFYQSAAALSMVRCTSSIILHCACWVVFTVGVSIYVA